MKGLARRVRVGCCISGHGFGHATRCLAILQALARLRPVEYVILTSAPARLFAESLTAPYSLHHRQTDVGLVQETALSEDLGASLRALDDFYPLAEERVQDAAALFAGCALVLADIAPLGIAAAGRAGIPSVLIENFTWDWIYAGYLAAYPAFAPHIDYLSSLFARADRRIQAEPVCAPVAGSLKVAPVARTFADPDLARQRLHAEAGQKVVLLTMGGLGGEATDLEPLLARPELLFVLPGQSRENEFSANLRFLGREAGWYHPDLVAAADLVVGKLGYSTVAELYRAGTPFAWLGRPGFRESKVLAAFVDSHLDGWNIDGQAWQSGAWLDRLPSLADQPAPPPRTINGADQAARFVTELLANPA